MALDMDNLSPAVDIDNIDLSNVDRGDTLDALNEALRDDPVPGLPPVPEAKELTEPEKAEKAKEAEEAAEEKQPRNEKGQFDKKEPHIPKSRFDEQVGKEREAREAAEQRAAALEKQLNERMAQEQQNTGIAAMETKVSEMEKQYNQLLLDGEVDKATEIMSQIRKTERQISTMEVEQRTAQRTSQILESERVELAIATAESQYPQLNPESEQFDEQLVNFVLSEQQRLMKVQGVAASKALEKAAASVMTRFAPQEKTTAEDKPGLAKAAAADRKADAVKRNLEVAKAQAPDMRSAGMDSDKAGSALPDVTKMSQEEFAALPESVKARLRGDDV